MALEQFSSYQIGKMLDVSRQAVNQWIDKGYIRAYRTPGGHRRVRREDLIGFLEARGIPIPDSLHGLGAGEGTRQQIRVMVVDDDTDYSTLLTTALQERVAHIEIQTFNNGYDALVDIGAHAPDVVILDLQMPKIDGIEVCRRLKQNDRARNLPILVVTAHDSRENIEALRAMHVDQVFSKNEPLKDIADSLALYLHRRQAALVQR